MWTSPPIESFTTSVTASATTPRYDAHEVQAHPNMWRCIRAQIGEVDLHTHPRAFAPELFIRSFVYLLVPSTQTLALTALPPPPRARSVPLLVPPLIPSLSSLLRPPITQTPAGNGVHLFPCFLPSAHRPLLHLKPLHTKVFSFNDRVDHGVIGGVGYPGQVNKQYRYFNSGTITVNKPLPAPGTYRLYYWASLWSSHSATVPVTVTSRSGAKKEILVNCRGQNGAHQWVDLGAFDLKELSISVGVRGGYSTFHGVKAVEIEPKVRRTRGSGAPQYVALSPRLEIPACNTPPHHPLPTRARAPSRFSFAYSFIRW